MSQPGWLGVMAIWLLRPMTVVALPVGGVQGLGIWESAM